VRNEKGKRKIEIAPQNRDLKVPAGSYDNKSTSHIISDVWGLRRAQSISQVGNYIDLKFQMTTHKT